MVLVALGGTLLAQAAPRNVILFIGDGMGSEQVKAATLYKGDPLSFEGLPYQGMVTTYSANAAITDSAAAATAIATGVKVNNGVISLAIPGDGSKLETLLELYQKRGKKTGLLTTAYLTHATPAAFGAHETNRGYYSDIGTDYRNQSRPNILFGGGGNGLEAAATASSGYAVALSTADFGSLDPTAEHLAGLFGTGYMPYEAAYLSLRETYPYPRLNEMVAKALDALEEHPEGFFLMVEAARIDHACHSNLLVESVHETLELGNAVQVALDWMSTRTDTLLLVTADHETGGLSVTADNGANEYPDATFSSIWHTSADVPVYATGPNADLVTGVMDNTEFVRLCTLEGTTQPAIFRVSVQDLDRSSATIVWATDEASDSLVEYRETGSATWLSAFNSQYTTSHRVSLDSLTVGSNYEYRVSSSNGPATNSSAIYFFVPDDVDAAPQPSRILVDLDATAFPAGPLAVWPNTGLIAGDFHAEIDVPVVTAVPTGSPDAVKGVTLDGNNDWYVGPAIPSDTVTGAFSRTIEAWVFNPALESEEAIVAWGCRGGPGASNMSLNHGSNATYGGMSHWNANMGWSGKAAVGSWTFVAYSYDEASRSASLFVDGRLVTKKNGITLSTHKVATEGLQPLHWIVGNQNEKNGTRTNPLSGSMTIGRLRVYKGARTEQEIWAQFEDEAPFFGVDGPRLSAPGNVVFPDSGGDPVTALINISNAGFIQALNITAVTPVDYNAAQFTVDSFPAMIAPGENADIQVTFTPPGAPGLYGTNLRIVSDSLGESSATIVLAIRVGGRIAHYALATDLNDSVGWNHGTFQGTGGANSSASFVPDPRFGPVLDFDGTDDRIHLGNIHTLRNSGWSISMWVKTPMTEDTVALLGKNNGDFDSSLGERSFEITGNQTWNKLINPEPAGNFAVNGYSMGGVGTNQGAVSLDDGIWHMLTAVHDNSVSATDMTLYIDGVAQPLGGQTLSNNSSADFGHFYLGFANPTGTGAASYFTGQMAEVSFYDIAIDQATVDVLFAAGSAGNYDTWAANYPGLELSNPAADLDGDGLANVVEAWFGTHPGQWNLGLATTPLFSHPQNPSPPGDVAGSYQWSANLIDWHDNGSGPAGGPDVTLVPVTVGRTTTVTPTTSGPLERIFLRVSVTRD